jgi:acyl-CoA synthetase (AMP-forming)/AMP-acid ligase II
VLPEAAAPGAARGALGSVATSWFLPDGSLDPAHGTVALERRMDVDVDQAALVLYTSGSTGLPQGVIQTFRNIDSNSRSIVAYLALGPTDRAMLTLPLSYCYGRSVLQTHLLVGGSVFLDHRTAFPRTVLEAMAAEGCTGFAGVPLTFEVIRRQVDVSTLAFPRLRYLTQAGGAMAAETIDWVRGAFAPAELYVMYGQTEATARLSYLPPDRAAEKRGSIGVPIPGVDLRVVDDDGREQPAGVIGELVARGANVTPGYLDDPEETARILHDGWLWTGDLAERDEDGFLYHRGRAREILKVGGHRVSPVAIEMVLVRDPQVEEAVVIGAPDDLLGEVPVAVVVPAPGIDPDERGLLQLCREQLPGAWVPARFVFVGSLPRNESGKPLRREVARLYGERGTHSPTLRRS